MAKRTLTAAELAKYDVTRKICQYLDPHLVMILLNSLKAHKVFDRTDILNELLRIILQTQMWNHAIEVWSELHPNETAPEEFERHREESSKRFAQQEAEVVQIVGTFDPETVTKLEDTATVSNADMNQWLRSRANFTDEMFLAISDVSKTQFECGDYEGASAFLALFLRIWPKNDPLSMSRRWGKLCCEILNEQWSSARGDLDLLKEMIAERASDLRDTNQKADTLARAWLIHWHLFVDFSSPDQSSHFINIVCDSNDASYWQTFRNYCPHLFRYLIAAALLNKNATTSQWMTKLVENTRLSFTQETEGNMDPLLDFAISLYREFNFERAKRALALSEQVLLADPFLGRLEKVVGGDQQHGDRMVPNMALKIFDSARSLMYEFVCGAGIYARLSIPEIARDIGKENDETEKWIVDIIKQANLEAKIDSEQGEIKLESKVISPYSALKNKTKMVNIEMQRLRATLQNKRY